MMQVKNIIRNLCCLNDIRVTQLDAYINSEEEEEIYYGPVLDMPWYILDYYLVDPEDLENGKEYISIGGIYDKDKKTEPCFDIYVMEKYHPWMKN